MNTRWLVRPLPRPDAHLRLFCFPYAGIGASAYRPWAAQLPREIELVAVQPPGRENRLGEATIQEFTALVSETADAVGSSLDMRFAFFGHSMGAALAFEVARTLRDRGLGTPELLVVSGRRAPHLPNPEPLLHPLSDAAFVTEVQRRYSGIPAEVLEHEDLLGLLLPGLRADIRALERHSHIAGDPLDCRILACGGAVDPLVSPGELDAWGAHTRRSVAVEFFPGGHFYLREHRDALLAAIADAVLPGVELPAMVSGR
jgi:medium-chain acyl-[acyl-carrier-protein] hydrolase